jgi:hypothetical protein
MEFFDVNCLVGRDTFHAPPDSKEESGTADNFFLTLLKHNIKNTVLTNRMSLIYDWNTGNEELTALIEQENTTKAGQKVNVFSSFVLCPDVYHMFDFGQYMEKAYKNRARIFRIFPKAHLFYLNDYYMQKIFNVMAEASFPLMLDMKELDITGNKYFALDDLRMLLAGHKKMPVILETSLKQCMFNRFYFPLLEEYENLYIETSGMLLMHQIEHYVEKFGSGRLIFGSNYPANDFAINTSRIESSEMSENDRNNICRENIMGIFNKILI